MNIIGRTPFQVATIESIATQSDFAHFVTTDNLTADQTQTFSTDEPPAPVNVLWYDREDNLHLVKVGINKVLRHIVAKKGHVSDPEELTI